ncbi:MAG: lipoyl protein ligase domain-containing protein [Hyphomicrobium sp.]
MISLGPQTDEVANHFPLARAMSDTDTTMTSPAGSDRHATAGDDLISFDEAIAAERAALSAITAEPEGSPVRCLLWRTPQAIIVPRGMPSRAGFDAARVTAGRFGYTLFERDTGGDLTPQCPGVVNLSMIFNLRHAKPSLAEAYHRLTAPIVAFLDDAFAIKARVASIPGAFCDGAYNVAVGDDKLAGTAQRWRLSANGQIGVGVLAHAAIMCTNDLDHSVDAMNAMYPDLGIDRRIDRARHVRLADLIGSEQASAHHVAARLQAYLARDGYLVRAVTPQTAVFD